ncbi:prlC, partial [Symbiodinium sp. CCMP2456]
MKAKLRQMQVARDADLGRLQEQLSANLATVQNRDEELMAAEARLQAWSAEAAQLRTSAQGEAQLRASCERQSAVLRSKLEQASASHSQLETQLRELQTELNEEATAAQRYKDCNSTLEEELKQAHRAFRRKPFRRLSIARFLDGETVFFIVYRVVFIGITGQAGVLVIVEYVETRLNLLFIVTLISMLSHVFIIFIVFRHSAVNWAENGRGKAFHRQNEETAQREKEEQHAHLANLESYVPCRACFAASNPLQELTTG